MEKLEARLGRWEGNAHLSEVLKLAKDYLESPQKLEKLNIRFCHLMFSVKKLAKLCENIQFIHIVIFRRSRGPGT